ncbi:MAG: tetratricopeptide repeat protein [Acidobacteriia bacterium]|nr:tetratricopeptide repeat protein [Terriglobia bacterium]
MIPLGLLFALTVALARSYHTREDALVRQWFQAGNRDLSAGQPRQAFEDFRNALAYDPENRLVQLRLAEALLADGQLSEARSYLVTLWERAPGSGEVNSDLAHVSVRIGDGDDAARYFQAAIYGSWETDPARQRRNVRLELCEFLLARNRTEDAQAELAALAADIPPGDAGLLEKTGRLLLQAGRPARALAEFEAELRINPRQGQWLEDAGNAAMAAGDYAKAETYLARAVREHSSEQAEQLLATARDVMSGDPFQPGLSDQEQARRTSRAFNQGQVRLQKCAGGDAAPAYPGQSLTDLQSLNRDAQGLRERATLRLLTRDPELRKEAMQLVFRIETATANSCGQPSGMDRALLLIGQRHEGNIP